jgi:hypothetical protein
MKTRNALISLLSIGAIAIAADARAEVCARLYEHANYEGEVKTVNSGATVTYIGNLWNDIVSSAIVEPGCALNVWEHADFGGRHATYAGEIPYVGTDWNDIISAYTCVCGP